MFPSNSGIHPSQVPLHFVLAPLLHHPSHLQILVPVRDSKLLVISEHNGAPRTSLFNDSDCPISVSPLLNFIKRPSHSAPRPHVKNGCTNLTTRRANLTPNGTLKNPSKFSLLTLPSTTQSLSHPNQDLFLSPQSGTRNHSHSHLLPHSPPPSLLLQMTKQRLLTKLPTTYHPNARPLFVCFFIHCLFFQFREQPLLPSQHPLNPITPVHYRSCRPPPCSSVPADCVFKVNYQSSVFSLSLYKVVLDLRNTSSFLSELDDFQFDMDLKMDAVAWSIRCCFPSHSFNINLETDIANDLEEL